jgi:ABC-2 type transport system permease protein
MNQAGVSGPGGNIYDLGYQVYDGPRLGRRAAFGALFRHALRACYGIGRGGRAKIVPVGLAILALLPAVLAVGISALAAQAPGGGGDILEDASPVRFATYSGLIGILVMLFAAAQGPELFGRDQRYGVLPLYFSRVLTRIDYALAKTGGLWVALLLMITVPQVLLLAGRIFVAPDPVQGFQKEIGAVPQVMAQALLTAGLLGSLTAAVASHTPRRAYATAIIIAIFIIPSIVVALVGNLVGQDAARFLVLFSPGDILDGTNAWIYDSIPDSPIVASLDLPGLAYVGAAVVGIAAATALTIRRYLTIRT